MGYVHELEIKGVVQKLNTRPEQGLSDEEAARRLQGYGPNEIKDRGAKSPWKILWEQLTAAVQKL